MREVDRGVDAVECSGAAVITVSQVRFHRFTRLPILSLTDKWLVCHADPLLAEPLGRSLAYGAETLGLMGLLVRLGRF